MLPDPSNIPPSKANLKAWWSHFTSVQKSKKETDAESTGPPVFGKPLEECLNYASVQISTVDAKGERYVWGYIPIVIAKCGLYLKENATEVAGIFRVNGSSKRMRELQAKFDSPPKYGKSIDWKKEIYTPHDVASVFRRYFTHMPEPVICHHMYHNFRDVLKPSHHRREIVATYQRLIRELPRPNQFLLLYVLDLLSVFARKSEKNLMTAANLGVIFQPGLISHPDHEMSPGELSLSQRVLEFLIEHQDSFMIDTPQQSRHPAPARTFSEMEEEDSDPSGVGGPWKLVERERRPSVTRRRTTMESSDSCLAVTPVDQPPGPQSPGKVKRSRTLPSQKQGNEGEEHRARVLRKQKRASAMPTNRSGTPERPRD